MDEEKNNPFDIGKMSDAWMQSVTDLWTSVLNQSSPDAQSTSDAANETAALVFLRLNEISIDGFSSLSKEMSGFF